MSDIIIQKWKEAKAKLDAAKAEEMALRQAVTALVPSGTGSFQIGDVTVTRSESYTLDTEKTAFALSKLRSTPHGEFIAPRLVKWKPTLDVREFKACTTEIQALFNDALTIKPSAPTITVRGS
jgi:hypothetical protein